VIWLRYNGMWTHTHTLARGEEVGKGVDTCVDRTSFFKARVRLSLGVNADLRDWVVGDEFQATLIEGFLQELEAYEYACCYRKP
jgi:hypothetical protein